MQRTTCGCCLGSDLTPILDLGSSPLADEFLTSPAESLAQTRYPLGLLFCGSCMQVQLSEVVPDHLLYGPGYGFYSGTSKAILAYYDQYATWLMGRYRDQARRLTVEVACNDGGLLGRLKEHGATVVGVDPSSGPAAVAQEAGLDVVVAPFSAAVAQDLVDQYGQAGLLVANHVVAHVTDPNDFMQGLRTLMAPDGVAVLECQYLPDLLAGNMFDHVYHEHRFFFTIRTLTALAHRNGLSLDSVEWVDRQGGSIRASFTHSRDRVLHSSHVAEIMSWEGWAMSLPAMSGLQGRADRMRHRMVHMLDEEHRKGHLVAGYGAPAKATTLIHSLGLNGPDLEWVQDTTPGKQGRYMPGTHIPVLAPKDEPVRPDTYVLFVWNYVSEILRKEASFMANGGTFIMPVPYPVKL